MILLGTVEIPKGSNYKYEIHNDKLYLDRIVDQKFPFNYGFINKTLAEDGDALDVFILSDHLIQPGAIVSLELIDVALVTDNGVSDDKLVCKLEGDRVFHLSADKTELASFLRTYKKGLEFHGFGGPDAAHDILVKARNAWFPSL